MFGRCRVILGSVPNAFLSGYGLIRFFRLVVVCGTHKNPFLIICWWKSSPIFIWFLKNFQISYAAAKILPAPGSRPRAKCPANNVFTYMDQEIWNAPNPILPAECYSLGGIYPILSIYYIKKTFFAIVSILMLTDVAYCFLFNLLKFQHDISVRVNVSMAKIN